MSFCLLKGHRQNFAATKLSSVFSTLLLGIITVSLFSTRLAVRATFVHSFPKNIRNSRCSRPTPQKNLRNRFAITRIMSTSQTLANGEVAHIDKEELPDWMKPERTKILSTAQRSFSKPSNNIGAVLYWMQRDMRTTDNWALLLAKHYAETLKLPLHVVCVLPPPPASSNNSDDLPPDLASMPLTERHGSFLLGGLELIQKELKEVNVPFHALMPSSHEKVGEAVDKFVSDYKVRAVVCDFSPLRHFRQWNEQQALPLFDKRKIPFYQVDTHNVVPVWEASPKREVGARTLRPRIHKVVDKFTAEFPEFTGNNHLSKDQIKNLAFADFDRKKYESFLNMDGSVKAVDWAKPGTENGMKQFRFFVEKGLKRFDQLRNDPTEKHICSDLSPWINYGHISFQTILTEVKKLNKYANGTASFVEEGLVRRELSDNYCYYAPNDYDSLDAAAGWARETLETHASDEREYIYSLEEFEQGKTHDDLWNAAQLQVVREGRMHGFLRMYWAKKILEWTASPVVALRTAQYMNDKFALGECAIVDIFKSPLDPLRPCSPHRHFHFFHCFRRKMSQRVCRRRLEHYGYS